MRFLATCLLLIYISVSCRPVFPVLADGLAHLLWYQHHVETVHMHDGHAHVHSEITEAMSDETGDHGTAPVPAKSFKISDFLAAHIVAEIQLTPIPYWIKLSGRPVGSPVFYMGTHSMEVPVPPPNCTLNTLKTTCWIIYTQTYAAKGQCRSRVVCNYLKNIKSKIRSFSYVISSRKRPVKYCTRAVCTTQKTDTGPTISFFFSPTFFTVTV